MRISKGFIKSSLIYTLAGMLPMASAFILLPFYIADLSVADYGALAIYQAFALLIQILTTYSFDTSLYIHFHELKHDKPRLDSFISSAFVLMLLIGAGVGLLALAVGDFTFSSFFSDNKAIAFFPYGILSAITGIFQALFKVHSNLVQSREQPELFFWSNLVSFMLIAVLTIVGLQVRPYSLFGPVGGRMLAVLIMGLWALFRIFREYGVHFNFAQLRESFQFNLYTFIYQLQQWVINYSDRFIMLFFNVPLAYVGVYDFGVKCLVIIELVLNGLHNSFYPKVIRIMMTQEQKQLTLEINRYYNSFLAVIILFICFCILTLPIAIGLFADKPGYRMAIPYIPFIAVLYLFRSMRLYFAVPYGVLKYTKPLPVIYIVVSVAKITAMILLLDTLKVYGVILSTLISSVAEILLLKFFIREKFTYTYNVYKIVFVPVMIACIIAVAELSLGVKYPLPVHMGYVVVGVVLLAWVYRRELKLIDLRTLIK